MAALHSPEDRMLLERVDQPFSEPVMFTCTYEALVGNISRSHEELTHVLEPSGAIKAINSNFGHKAQPGYESFLKHPKVAPPEPRGRLAEAGRRRNGLAPANTRQRKPQGDATCFNSALELTIIPGPDDDPPEAVRRLLAENPDKYYAVKSFPTTGQTQVPGVVCSDLADGAFVARLWARFLTEAGVGTDPAEPVTVVQERPIMVNFKFHLIRRSDRILLNLAQIVEHLEAAKVAYEVASLEGPERQAAEDRLKRQNPDAWRIYIGGAQILPFPIREIKSPQDGQNLSFKFVCPTRDGGSKKVRVNIFYRGKVNILGACDFESPQAIYGFLSELIHDNWSEFVGLKPLPDRARRAAAQRRAARPAVPPQPARVAAPRLPLDHTVAPENHLADDDFDALLGGMDALAVAEKKSEARDGPPPPAANSRVVSVADILALAAGFGAEFGGGGLDDAAFDQVQGEDVEDHEKDPLNHDAV